MAQRSMFFDAVSGDRSYDATAFAALLRVLVHGGDGVFYLYGSSLYVSATDPASMNVNVGLGAAFVQGRMLEVHTAGETLAIGAADPVNPRIDRIVVKLDNSSAVRSVRLAVKAGTPAASPTPPTLQRDGTVWELSLAQVYVAAGATSISTANITDERPNPTVCGWVPMLAQPAVRVYHNAAQSIPNTTWTPLAFNSERFDIDAMHDPITNNSRLTCKTAGKYLIIGNVSFAPNATGMREVFVILNGITKIGQQSATAISGTSTILSVSTLYNLAANDYVELWVNQNSGAALNVEAVANISPEFMMIRVG